MPTSTRGRRCWKDCIGQHVALADGQVVAADENYIRESILHPGAKIVSGWTDLMPTFRGQVSERRADRVDRVHPLARTRAARRSASRISRARAAKGHGNGEARQ